MTDDQTDDERMRLGREQLTRLNPRGEADMHEALDAIAPDMPGLVVAFGFGDIVSRPGLALPDRETATIAALASLGNAEPQLRFHIGGGLSVGLSAQEIVEIIYVTSVFAGFPAGLNALFAARKVFEARGLRPQAQDTAPPASAGADRRARGLAALEATSRGSGQAVLESLADIAPDMAAFILDFAYGDVIARPGLSLRRKELAMIAACVARGTMRPQLKVHVKAGLNVGLTQQELVEAVMQMAVYAGFPAAINGLIALREALGEAGQTG